MGLAPLSQPMSSRADSLTAAERERLEALRSAQRLADLVALTDADDEEAAYFAARREWSDLRDRELPAAGSTDDDLPSASVEIDGRAFHVHGVTHTGTDAERAFLRDRVADVLAAGGAVYCEQGIRSMYFDDIEDVCEIDDYRWALAECLRLDEAATTRTGATGDVSGVGEEVAEIRDRVREVVFSLVESGSDVYGEEFARVLGDVATGFLSSHEDVSTGRDFESFVRSRRAAEEPSQLGALQRYYERTFLPQPLEREWLQRHDPELEVLSHARNERMADYAVFHNDEAESVHLVVGAAHQPGVRYYLERHRDGYRDVDDFELL